MKSVEFIDVTIRDAHQSLWATRMTNAMMMPFAHRMDEMGFYAIDIVGGAVFDVCVRFLREDPWERMALLRAKIPNTPLNVWLRGQSLFTFELFPDDVVELAIERIADKGIDRLTTFDPLNDLRNVELSVRVARSLGMHVTIALAYTLSPVHTDAYFQERAHQLVAMGIDELLLKDATGVLTPERTRTLIPALKEATGERVPLQLHSHCRAGLAPQCYLEAIPLGVSVVHTASRPLANGASLPATEYVNMHAKRMGYSTRLDEQSLEEMASYFAEVARRHGKPLGELVEYDPRIYEHQIPGGMISNLMNQLSAAGIADKFDAIIEETARVREDLGYPVIVSPFAQFVVTQATLNVIQKERYKTIPDEIRKYALGRYGRPAGPLNPEFMERATRGEQPVSERPGALLEPALDQVRRKRGPFLSDEDLLLGVMYGDEVLGPFFRARSGNRPADPTARPLPRAATASRWAVPS